MPSNTKPIGVAYTDQDIIGSQYVLAGEQLGYTADAQGTVTQATSKATGVTLNKSSGRITMNAASLANQANVLFTLTNNAIGVNDVIIVSVSGGGTVGAYWPYVASLASGSAVLGLFNNTAGPLAEAVVLNFCVIHGAA